MKNAIRESTSADSTASRAILKRRAGRSFQLAAILHAAFFIFSIGAASTAGAFTNLTLTNQSQSAVIPGASFSYSLVAKNTGGDVANGTISLRDPLPQGLTFVGVDLEPENPVLAWSCNYILVTRTVACDRPSLSGSAPPVTIRVMAPNLAPGAPPLSIVNTANISCASCTESDTTDNTASATTRIEFTDLGLQKLASNPAVPIGAPLGYIVYATNTSEAVDTSAAQVLDDLPAGVTGIHAWGDDWICDLSGPADRHVHCVPKQGIPGALPPVTGVSEPIRIAVLAPVQQGTIENMATVESVADGTPNNNTAAVSVQITGGMPAPDLTLSNTSAVTSPIPKGSGYNYVLTASNSAGVAESGLVTVHAVVPYPNLILADAQGAGWDCSWKSLGLLVPDAFVTCTRTGLAAAAVAAPVTLTVVAGEAGNVKVRAWVTGSSDSNPGNNIADVVRTIGDSNAPDLAIASTSNPSPPATVGRSAAFTYTLAVTNSGPGLPAGTTTVVDVLPKGVSLTTATGSGWSCNQSAGTVTCTRTTTFAVDAPSITLSVVAPDAPGTLVNRAYVFNSIGDRNTANNDDSLSVQMANAAPTATNDLYETPAGQTLMVPATGVIANDSDGDGDPLSAILNQHPAHGTLTLSPDGGFTYTPEAGFAGPDTFKYHVNDGAANSNVATVAINVIEDNTAPVAYDQTLLTPKGLSRAVTLTASDADGDPITFSIVDIPDQGGQLTGTPPNITYVPPEGFEGVETFTFEASDGALDSNMATVTITVGNGGAGNQAPVAEPQTLATAMNATMAIALHAVDPEGAALVYAIVDAPDHGGQVTGAPPDVIYTPATDFNGIETFSFKANDGTLDSNLAVVTITVGDGGSGNQPPVAQSQNLAGVRDMALPVTLVAVDPEGASLSFTVVAPPNGGGTLQGTPPSLIYHPAAGFTGTETFAFKANDGTHDSNMATVAIDVADPNPVNEAPVANDQWLMTPEATPKAIVLSASDADGDALSFSIATAPAVGALTGTPPNVTYTPPDGFNGVATFTFTANDGLLDSAPATVTIGVGDGGPGNQAPVAEPQSVYVPRSTPTSVVLTGSDPDGDALGFSVVDVPTLGGQLEGTAPDLVFVPAFDFDGVDSFTFRANDGALDSNLATVVLTIGDGGPGNQAPVAMPMQLATATDEPRALRLAAVDPDGDALDFAIVAAPNFGGTLQGTAPDLTYRPPAGFNGIETFTFKASDGELDSNVASVSVVVGNGGPGNQAPVAYAQDLSTPQNQGLPITLSATDPDGDPIDFEVGSLTRDGELTGTPPNLSYMPAPGFNGIEMFTFRASDGTLASNAAVITIRVGSAAPPTIACFLPDLTFEAGDAVSIDAGDVFAAPAGQGLVYGANGLPASLAIDAGTGVVTGVLAGSDVLLSPFLANLTATTVPGGATASDSARIIVLPDGEILLRNGFDGADAAPCP